MSKKVKTVENSDRTLADSKGPAFFIPQNSNEKNVENSDEDFLDAKEDNGIDKVKCRNERLEGENHTVTDVPFVKKRVTIDMKTVEVVVLGLNE